MSATSPARRTRIVEVWDEDKKEFVTTTVPVNDSRETTRRTPPQRFKFPDQEDYDHTSPFEG